MQTSKSGEGVDCKTYRLFMLQTKELHILKAKRELPFVLSPLPHLTSTSIGVKRVFPSHSRHMLFLGRVWRDDVIVVGHGLEALCLTAFMFDSYSQLFPAKRRPSP